MECKEVFWPPGDLQGWGENRMFCEGGEWGINSYYVERWINQMCQNKRYSPVSAQLNIC